MADLNEEENLKRLDAQLKAGIQQVLLSQNFKNFLETQSAFFSYKYSFRNSFLIKMQIPYASYVMGAEGWKKFGRSVTDNTKGAFIVIPVFTKKDSQYLKGLKDELSNELRDNPGLEQAKISINNSKIVFTLQKNGIWGIEEGKQSQRFYSEKEFNSFFYQNIINKLPPAFKSGQVFDIKDTDTPEYLWVKNGFSYNEAARDDKGNCIRNGNNEYKIINSPERINRFQQKLDFVIPQNDRRKMELLFGALRDVCKNNGISIEAVGRGMLPNGNDGCDALFNFENYKLQYSDDLSIERRISCIFHELAHAFLHNNLNRLAGEMAVDKNDIDHSVMEIQAEATAYLTAKKFGIETDTESFQYLAAFTDNLAMPELEKSLSVIHRASNTLLSEIEKELIKSGYNLALDPVPVTQMDRDQLRTFALKYAEDAVVERSSAYADVLHDLTQDYEKAMGAEKENIEDQIRCVTKINGEIAEMKKLLRELYSITDLRDKAKILGIVEGLDTAFNNIYRLEARYDYLIDEHMAMLKENDNRVSRFLDDPVSFLNDLKPKYAVLAELSTHELDYIVKSKVISEDYSYLLRNERDVPQFVDIAAQRAFYIDDMCSKNGTFIEINNMDNIDPYNRPAFARGELCHPKYADALIQETEEFIRHAKARAKENNEYYPYSRCDLTVYTPNKNGGLNSLETALDIGDKSQKGLSDHLRQCCKTAESKEIFRAYSNSLRDSVWEFHAMPKIPTFDDSGGGSFLSAEKGDANDKVQNLSVNKIEQQMVKGPRSHKLEIGEGA